MVPILSIHLRLVYILILLFATVPIAHAAPQSPHATIDRRGVTTLSWQQPQPAQVCIYQDVLLFCREYQAGPQFERLGTRGPLVAHVVAGDVLVLREVGGGEARVRVERRYDLWMPLMRR